MCFKRQRGIRRTDSHAAKAPLTQEGPVLKQCTVSSTFAAGLSSLYPAPYPSDAMFRPESEFSFDLKKEG